MHGKIKKHHIKPDDIEYGRIVAQRKTCLKNSSSARSS